MLALPLLLLGLLAQAPDPASGTGDVVLLRQMGISAFEDATEGFLENCRVRVRQVPLDNGPELIRRVGPAQLVVAIGQAAVDAGRRTGKPIVYALAPSPPPGAVGADAAAPPELVLRALTEARRGVRRVGVVAGKNDRGRLTAARLAARLLGLELVERAASSGPEAIVALRDLSLQSPPIEALWIGADPQLVTTPVFQYALQLQLSRNIPVLASTRQQVRSGAFLAVDWPPRLVGRRLAALVFLVLEGMPRAELSGREDPAGAPQITLNGLIAKKLGVDLVGRRAAGWRIE